MKQALQMTLRGTLAALTLVTATHAHAAAVAGQGTWETDLVGRDLDGNTANGFEAYYDKALNITWAADANYAGTISYPSYYSSFGPSYRGRTTWYEAQALAQSLNIGGVTGWRLPNLTDTGTVGCNFAYSGSDCGPNVDVSTSEMAHLFFVTLGNKSYIDANKKAQANFGLSNAGPFSNIQTNSGYWFNNVDDGANGETWAFGFNYGVQGGSYNKLNPEYAFFVHDGDVGTGLTAAVPEPDGTALMMAGIVVISAALRRQRKS